MIKQKSYKSGRDSDSRLSIETNSNKGGSNCNENSILSNEVSSYNRISDSNKILSFAYKGINESGD